MLILLLAPEALAEPQPRRPTIQPFVQLQTWATLYDQDESVQADPASYGDPEHDPGFLIRRARLGFQGRLDAVDFALSAGTSVPFDVLSGTGDEDVGLVDAYGRYTLPQRFGTFFVSMGAQKVPFSREMLISSSQLVFQERSVGTEWLNPLRDVGAIAGQTIRIGEESDSQVTLRAGAFNGNGSILGDTDPGVLLVGRLEYTLGETYTTNDPDPALGVGLAAYQNTELSTTTKALGVDGLARLGGVTALFEGTYASFTPTHPDLATPSVLAATNRFGAMGQVSYRIPVFKSAIEPAYRIATFDDAIESKDNGDVALMHIGGVWRSLVRGVDLGAAWVHRMEREGVTTKNDTFRVTAQVVYPPR